MKVEPDTLQAMPLKLVHRRNLMPLSRNNGTLVVATGDPFDVYALDELQTLTGLHVQPVLASPREIARLIKTHFGVGGETVAALVQERGRGRGRTARRHRGRRQRDWPRGPGSLGRQAGQRDPDRSGQRAGAATSTSSRKKTALRIRYRIDGLLQTQPLPPEINRFQAAIISRLKIMARLNIAEKRLPQDGRIKMRVQGREIDVRVSIIPMIHGEGIVMRLLDKGRMVFNLANVGMLPDIYKHVQAADRPAARHRPGHRPDRLRQDRPRSTRALNEIKDETTQDHHGRRPGRIPAAGHQPDSGARQDRPDVRRRRCAASCVTTRT